jgi:hypothetical protein
MHLRQCTVITTGSKATSWEAMLTKERRIPGEQVASS